VNSTTKRALLYRFGREALECIVNPSVYLCDGHIEVLTTGGALHCVSYEEVKAICFFSSPGPADLFTSHTAFERRPKMPGLWARFTFRDGDRLEGVLPRNLLEWPATGYLITPPRAAATRQRVFVPRAALTGTELLGVMGVARVPVPRRQPVEACSRQLTIFDP
jgi:hypothetical protein